MLRRAQHERTPFPISLDFSARPEAPIPAARICWVREPTRLEGEPPACGPKPPADGPCEPWSGRKRAQTEPRPPRWATFIGSLSSAAETFFSILLRTAFEDRVARNWRTFHLLRG